MLSSLGLSVMAVLGNEYSRTPSLPSAYCALASDLPMALRSPHLSLYPIGCPDGQASKENLASPDRH